MDDLYQVELAANNTPSHGEWIVDDFAIQAQAPPPPDTAAPVISNIAISGITSNSATITWQTDEPANADVDYGPDSTYGSSASQNTFDTSHSLTLSGLTDSTTYHFRVRSQDAAGNESASGDFTFITLPASGSGPLFADDFNSGDIDPGKWHLGANSGNRSAVIDNALHLRSQGNESGWLVTRQAFVARNTTVTVKFAQPNNDGNLGMSPTYSPASTSGIYSEPSWYRFYVYRSGSGGNYRLYVQWRKDGTGGGLDVTGSLAISGPVYLRLRIEDNTLHFEASLDGNTWITAYSELFSLPNYSPDAPFHYELSAYRTESKGELVVDDFSIRDGAAGSGIPPAQHRIMLVGNSITEGTGSSDGQGFRPMLYQKLTDAGVDFTFVGSEGTPPNEGYFFAGEKIDQFYPPGFDAGDGTGAVDIANVMPVYQPDIIMLHLGTNDLSRETYITPYSDDGGQTLNGSTSGQLAQLIKYILQWHDGTLGAFLQTIYVSQIIPRDTRAYRVVEFNPEVANLVADFANGTITGYPAPVVLVDHYTPFIENPDLFTGNENDYMSDALHPNDVGYDVMATTYLNAFIGTIPAMALIAANNEAAALEQITPGPVPGDYDLLQSYPNPFSLRRSSSFAGTTIRYQLPVQDEVRIEIYDILGRRVRSLVQAQRDAGFHQTTWDGRNESGLPVSSGTYLYVLRTPSFRKSLKLTVVR